MPSLRMRSSVPPAPNACFVLRPDFAVHVAVNLGDRRDGHSVERQRGRRMSTRSGTGRQSAGRGSKSAGASTLTVAGRHRLLEDQAEEPIGSAGDDADSWDIEPVPWQPIRQSWRAKIKQNTFQTEAFPIPRANGARVDRRDWKPR